MKGKVYIVIGFIMIVWLQSCQQSQSAYDLNKLQGYWQISSVKKQGELVTQYQVSLIIDYWQLNEDSSGFRKKVMPNLEGKFVITQHQMPFTVRPKKDHVQVAYDDNGNNYVEQIITLEDSLLVITNSEFMEYTYKRYKPLDLSDVTKG